MNKKVLGATALALLIGAGAAIAQSGGEARSNQRKIDKALDDKALTPIRPIRRVGNDSWPAAKDQPAQASAPRETTGQTPADDSAKQTPEPPKQDTAKQEPPKAEAPRQDAAKLETPKQDAAKAEAPKQNTAKPETSSQPAQAQQQNKPQDTAQDKSRDKQGDKQGFASIRLGTDKSGRVAVNDAQERQMSSALRKQHVHTVDVAVTVGAAAPDSVRLGAVSAEMVSVLPQFRGYSYFATRENIVIVEPDSRKIVAVVPVKLTATASRPQPARSETRVETTRKTADSHRETTGAAVADDVPSEAEILAAPVVIAPAHSRVVTRTAEPETTVVIEHRRRPHFFGFFR